MINPQLNEELSKAQENLDEFFPEYFWEYSSGERIFLREQYALEGSGD